MTRCAEIYERGEYLYFTSLSQTTCGVMIESDPVRVILVSASSAEKSKALHDVLAAFRDGVRHPNQDEWDDLPQPVLKVAGVKSWRTFQRGAKSCSLSEQNGAITITPTRYSRSDQAFFHLPDRSVTIASRLSDDQLIKGLEEAFARCV